MIFDMGKNSKHYPWKPLNITADDLETEVGMEKVRLLVRRTRMAIAAASMECILKQKDVTE